MSLFNNQTKRKAMSTEYASLKISLIGDACVGKTTLVNTYTSNKYQPHYTPTVFELVHTFINLPLPNNREQFTNLVFYDCSSMESYRDMRWITYEKSDLYLICFDMNKKQSLLNVVNKWYTEVKLFAGKAKVVLVGLKDVDRNSQTGEKVTTAMITQAREKMAALSPLYFEISVRNRKHVTAMVEACTREVILETAKSTSFTLMEKLMRRNTV